MLQINVVNLKSLINETDTINSGSCNVICSLYTGTEREYLGSFTSKRWGTTGSIPAANRFAVEVPTHGEANVYPLLS
jgi:hypothetical protein